MCKKNLAELVREIYAVRLGRQRGWSGRGTINYLVDPMKIIATLSKYGNDRVVSLKRDSMKDSGGYPLLWPAIVAQTGAWTYVFAPTRGD